MVEDRNDWLHPWKMQTALGAPTRAAIAGRRKRNDLRPARRWSPLAASQWDGSTEKLLAPQSAMAASVSDVMG